MAQGTAIEPVVRYLGLRVRTSCQAGQTPLHHHHQTGRTYLHHSRHPQSVSRILTQSGFNVPRTTVLDSKAAENTFAQVIYGLLTHAAFRENFQFHPTIPEILEREQPNEDSVKLFAEIRAGFQLANLEIP